jgi:predicted small secreted protein
VAQIEEVVMRKMLAVVVTLSMLIGMGAVLSACNTTAGAGEDLSATGHAITNGADKLKP